MRKFNLDGAGGIFSVLVLSFLVNGFAEEPQLGSARVVFQVFKGFVAQVADVANGRTAPMNDEQWVEAYKTVVGKFSQVKYVRGLLSVGRRDDPNSGGSSFSILLGNAPRLDGKLR